MMHTSPSPRHHALAPHSTRAPAPFLVSLLAVCLALPSPAPARTAVDLLELPAIPSAAAHKRMLLNLAWAGRRLLAAGERGTILYSDNNGKDWSQARVPSSVTLTAIYFPSPLNGWAVGHDGLILASQDGGATWNRQFDGNQANALVLEAAQIRLRDAQAAHQPPAVLQHLEDALEDARAGAKFGPSRPLFDVWFASDAAGYAVGAFGQVFRTSDAGLHWDLEDMAAINPDGLHINAISGQAGGAILLAAEAGKIFRLGAGATTWQRLDTGYTGQLFGVREFQHGGNGVLLAYGFGGNVFRSTDRGRRWSAIPTGTKKSLTASAMLPDGTLFLAAADGRLFKSTDGGRSFNAGAAAASQVNAMSRTENGRTLILAGAAGAVRYPLQPVEDPRSP